MTSKSPNEAGYADRLQFVDDLFTKVLKLAPHNIEVIAYDKDLPFPYNNFVFAVETKSKISIENRHGEAPGTVQIPLEHNKFILRLPNSDPSYNNDVRVENEVAALLLAREALGENFPHAVPRVFAWRSAAGGQQGWMLQEYMPGNPLADDFPIMGLDDQRKILTQMADILMRFQQYEIPSTVHGYGGLTFDETGQVVIGPMSIMSCGPFESYDDLVLGTIQSKLADADKNKWIRGWADNDKNIRTRLNSFLKVGFNAMMEQVTERKQTLVHADFSTDNLLYDPATMRITAVLDFDFGHIGTVADDFFRSLGHGIGRFPDPRDGPETLALNRAMLTEFPTGPDLLPPESTEDVKWPQAAMWDTALRDREMRRPGNIPGMETLSALFWLSAQLLPFKLSWDFIVENSGGEERARAWRASGEDLLDAFLTERGV